MATASPTWRARSRQSGYCGAWRTSKRIAAASPGGGAPKRGSGFIQRSRSANVKTRTTPGIRAAASVRILPMRACAWGDRRKAAWSNPGSFTSSTKRASPRWKRGSSLRRTAAPKYFAPMGAAGGRSVPLLAHGPDPVEPGRRRSQEEPGDRGARDEPDDREEDEGDEDDGDVQHEVHDASLGSSLDFSRSRIGGRFAPAGVLSTLVMFAMRATMSRMRRTPSSAWPTQPASWPPPGSRRDSRSREPMMTASGVLISWAAAPASRGTARSSAP